MRMIVAGGGTGGHLFPGLAVAEAVMAETDARVLFVGSSYGIEATAVPRTQFPFEGLAIRGLRRRGPRAALAFAWQLPVALLQAWRIVKSFRPHVVLGLGGYGSVPVVVAAWLCRVPSVLLEQNVRPGLANRLLAHLSRQVCTNFAASAAHFPAGKSVQTGNPVRQLHSTAHPSDEHFTIFVFGGSQGAQTINRAAVDAAQSVAAELPGVRILHQTGAADVEWVRQRYDDMGLAADVRSFVDDMGSAYAAADLVVCRAGATTLAELAAMGKPAILIPYPFAVDDHQRANAEMLLQHGAAELILDTVLTGPRLAQAILALAHDRARLAAMGTAARQLAVPDATARVVAVCRQVAAEGA
jgi:UDP-N-acetylglucosamine--N-acetylmuramyl-(pentapeptide) pyrophosphoryl-undecaprenol N-acetylglucosamine transferase